MVFFEAYCAATGDSQGYVVAAALAKWSGDWTSFSQTWRNVLGRKPEIDYFRSDEASATAGQFLGWPQTQLESKLTSLLRVVKQCGAGLTISAIDSEAYRRVLSECPNCLPTDPSIFSFLNTIVDVYQFSKDFEYRCCEEVSVSVIFGEDADTAPTAYDMAITAYPQLRELMAPTVVFRSQQLVGALQAADLVAFETSKYLAGGTAKMRPALEGILGVEPLIGRFSWYWDYYRLKGWAEQNSRQDQTPEIKQTK